MGHRRHHAIVVTGASEHLDEAHRLAVALGCSTSEITAPAVNDYRTFVVAPDGSKEGWTESIQGDQRRAQLIAFLESCRDDLMADIAWVEVQFGDDNLETLIVNDSDRSDRLKPG